VIPKVVEKPGKGMEEGVEGGNDGGGGVEEQGWVGRGRVGGGGGWGNRGWVGLGRGVGAEVVDVRWGEGGSRGGVW